MGVRQENGHGKAWRAGNIGNNDQEEGGDVIKSLLYKAFIKAKRNGSLFRVDRHVSSFVYLALRLKVRFVSLQLVRAAVAALKKLKENGDLVYSRFREGLRMAWAFSEAAVGWGLPSARTWRNDLVYASFLAKNLESA